MIGNVARMWAEMWPKCEPECKCNEAGDLAGVRRKCRLQTVGNVLVMRADYRAEKRGGEVGRHYGSD